MEATRNVEKEIDKVLAKFNGLHSHISTTLGDLINQLISLKSDLATIVNPSTDQTSISPMQQKIIYSHINKIREVINRISSEHRDLHGNISKFGKTIDRNFVSDFASVANEQLYDQSENQRVLNQAIIEHLLRCGNLEIAEQVMVEANLDYPPEKKHPFTELNEILDALKRKNLNPALEWAARNREALHAANSSVEFKLHRLQFIEFLVQGEKRQMDLIQYARDHFQTLAVRHEKEVQCLMGSIACLKRGLSNTPYAHFLDPQNWVEICDVFTRDACSLLGLSVESPLAVAFDAGCIALPALLNIKRVMQRQVINVWSAKDELPIEIDLGRKRQFHSIFACPILKQQSSEMNPPMRLTCGHVISRDALVKLANGSKLKCPYCPMEQNPTEAKQIQF